MLPRQQDTTAVQHEHPTTVLPGPQARAGRPASARPQDGDATQVVRIDEEDLQP
jgi:hypothetical protein